MSNNGCCVGLHLGSGTMLTSMGSIIHWYGYHINHLILLLLFIMTIFGGFKASFKFLLGFRYILLQLFNSLKVRLDHDIWILIRHIRRFLLRQYSIHGLDWTARSLQMWIVFLRWLIIYISFLYISGIIFSIISTVLFLLLSILLKMLLIIKHGLELIKNQLLFLDQLILPLNLILKVDLITMVDGNHLLLIAQTDIHVRYLILQFSASLAYIGSQTRSCCLPIQHI